MLSVLPNMMGELFSSLRQDAIALLAYEDPEKSPMFYLLSSEYRQQVADNLNRTLLGQFLYFSFSFSSSDLQVDKF